MNAGCAATLVHFFAVLLLSPLFLSLIAKTKAAFGGRTGPPWLQPYRELYKLLHKDAVYSSTTTWIFRLGPVVNLAALLTASSLMPLLSGTPLVDFPGNAILFVYLLALGRMCTVLAAMDTGSSFEAMGASREVTFGALAEPALLLALVVLSATSGSFQFSQMLGPAILGLWVSAEPALILVAGALFILLLTETCRVPVDDPATHLELTMIHEVMVLDHSGPDFAFISYGASLKFSLLGLLLLRVALPCPAALQWAEPALRLIELGGLAVAVGTLESTMARLRLNRVPLLLSGANVLAALAVAVVLARKLG